LGRLCNWPLVCVICVKFASLEPLAHNPWLLFAKAMVSRAALGAAASAAAAAAAVILYRRYRTRLLGGAGTFHAFLEEAADSELTAAAFTSRWVAAERALESQRPDALFHDELASALGGTAGLEFSKKTQTMMESMKGWADWHIAWMAIRTRAIDDQIIQFVAGSEGSFQVVNLGCGLDTRVWRLHQLSGCRAFFEVDQPAVLSAKSKVIQRLAAAAQCPRVDVALDLLEGSLRVALLAAGFDAACPTFWLLEGLTMYLSEAANLDLLGTISSLSAPGSFFCSGFIGDTTNLPAGMPFTPTQDEYQTLVTRSGWRKVRVAVFGDASLNYGRYPADRAPDAGQCFCFASK